MDSYTAGDYGTNGGASAGVYCNYYTNPCTYYANDQSEGLLLDFGGNDAYTSGSHGVNGGSNSASGGRGLLLDLGGTDYYYDSDGGTGTDKTVNPKGTGGAQIDTESPTPVPAIPEVQVTPNPDGSWTVYVDTNANSQQDSGEAGVTTPVPPPDSDADQVPDSVEIALCSQENPNLLSDGHCVGSDYTLPTPSDVVSDPAICETGSGVTVGEDQVCITTNCPIGQIGITVNGDPTCFAQPAPCDGGEVGVQAGETQVCESNPCPTPVGPPGPGELAKVCGIGVPNALPGDEDADNVPDNQEAALCGQENPNLLSDGHCTGNDYTLPTWSDVVSDVIWLATGTRP
jgi:hypothetical protein